MIYFKLQLILCNEVAVNVFCLFFNQKKNAKRKEMEKIEKMDE